MNYITIVMSLKIILTISLFRLVRSDQCSTSVSSFQFANFGDTNVDEDSYKKLVQSVSEMKHSALQMEQKLHRMFTGKIQVIFFQTQIVTYAQFFSFFFCIKRLIDCRKICMLLISKMSNLTRNKLSVHVIKYIYCDRVSKDYFVKI